MKVLVVTPKLYDTAPGARFRIEQWARHLEREGIEFTFAPFEAPELNRTLYQPGKSTRKAQLIGEAIVRRMRLVRTVKQYDLIYLYREAAIIGPAFIERRIARQGVPIVYDFDDPIWLYYQSPTNRAYSRLKWQSKVSEICKLATTVIVGNRLLANWAATHSRRVEVVPSTIDFDAYPPKRLAPGEKNSGPVTLGWTGSHSTLPFLRTIQPALHTLAAQRRYALLVISHTDSFSMDIAPAQVRSQKWNAPSEAMDLHAMDIGLAPFPNSGWTPWRCHGKVLQYMAVGLATVASNIGILPDYITDGENGMLISSEEEWGEKLGHLMDRREQREVLGRAARASVQTKYSAEVWVPKLKRILERAAGKAR